MRGVVEEPAGLAYHDDFLSRAEETRLLDHFASMDFEPVVMRGQAARRTVRHFGYGYDFESWRLQDAEPLPTYLEEIRARAASLANRSADHFRQGLVTRYPAGASIGWHKDATAFGSVVLGVSLASGCVMRFQRTAAGGERRVFEQPLAPRSAYVLAGAARTVWQHSIPSVPELRYSITFRSVRTGPGARADG